MNSCTFENLILKDVTTAMKVWTETQHIGLHEWRNITAYETLEFDSPTFECQINFLKEMMDVFENMKFGKRFLPSQTGAVWVSVSLMKLSKYWLKLGIKKLKTSKLLQNSIENLFSMIASYQSSPSA